MNPHVLVTYATKAGSTVAVADAIGDVLAARGFGVTIKPVKDKPSLDGYQAVVIGSAIRMGSWLPEAMVCARDNQARLSELPTAIFTVHLLNTGDDAASQAARQAYTAPVR
jgi:menaquinone-dependent protoporphyrinogen oxidase